MDRFNYSVTIDDEEQIFSFASYDIRKKEKELTANDYLTITMKVECCESNKKNQEVNILGLAALNPDKDTPAMESFRQHYVDALLGKDSEWILVHVRKDKINIELTFYSRQFNKRQSLTLDVRSRDIGNLWIHFEVPHKDGYLNTVYKWHILRDKSDSFAKSEITTLYKILPYLEKRIICCEGDDNISVIEYTDL